MCRKSELECFVKTTMSRGKDYDYRVQLIYEEYGVSLMYIVQTLNITEQTITSGLEIMAEEILLGEGNLSHVFVLLVFCMELDKHCKLKEYSWYSSEMLIEIIVNILWKVDFKPCLSLYSFKMCNIM